MAPPLQRLPAPHAHTAPSLRQADKGLSLSIWRIRYHMMSMYSFVFRHQQK